MTRHSLAILLLIVVVLSAGCASLISAGDSSPTADAPDSEPPPTTDSEQSNTSGTETDTSTSDSTDRQATDSEPSDTSTAETNQTSTTYPEWSEPNPPNLPLDNKIEPGRISDVQFVNTEPGPNGEDYADFDLQVTADTRMENVDPPDHGTVEGEPYFIVYINDTRFDQMDHIEIRESRFARMDNLQMRENGTFNIRINKRGLEQFEPGQLNIKVRLFDEDSQWDDIYGVWTGTVEYNPK